MKISCNWLRTHIDWNFTTTELSARLLQLGFEVAGIQRLGPTFSGVVVARVLSRDKHPNADKLSVCIVDDGAQKWNVVCGAPNVAAGQTIAFARIGAVLPGDFKIGKAKLRGVESQGMICSRSELGLPKDVDGIWVMSEGAALGTDVGSLLGPADDILEVEITSNRPDCLSHRGLARELAAAMGKTLKPFSFDLTEALSTSVNIHVEDGTACPFYGGRVIEGVTVGPSPAWLKTRLEAIGLRPINNVVDITNFVMHDLGQPLHAFDADKLSEGKVIVRRSKAGETLLALDHKSYSLPEGCLVIADAQRPVALAGVMGGEESSVTGATKRIILEGAYFNRSEVRRSSQGTRLRSDSSYRFERGVDTNLAAQASAYAATLIVQTAGGRAGKATNIATALPAKAPIKTTPARLNAILGADFPEAEILRVLGAISANMSVNSGTIEFHAPTWRGDLVTANDLAEEVGRLLGYDQVPYRLSALEPRAATLTPLESLCRRVRSRLVALGLWEAYNYDLLSEKALSACRLSSDQLPRINNPLSEDWAVLRPSLIPGLLKSAQYNLSRGAEAVRFFEIGKVYSRNGASPVERWMVSGLILGPVLDERWQSARSPRAGFPDAKAVVEDLLSRENKIEWVKLSDQPTSALFHPVNATAAMVSGHRVATVGWLHPRVARAFDLEKENAVIFEADLDWLATRPVGRVQFKAFSAYPISRRDLALVVDKVTAYAQIESSVRSCAIAELQDLRLFDVYDGKGIGEGKKSLAIRLTFVGREKTLTDTDINGFIDRILAAVTQNTGAVLRR